MALFTCPNLAWKLSMSRATGIPLVPLCACMPCFGGGGDLELYLHIAVSCMKLERIKVSGKLL
jgi:hypothetical protein